MRAFAAVALALAIASCVSARRAGNETSVAPLVVPPGVNVVDALRQRLGAIQAVRSLMRIRVTSGEKTQSFRAQMLVDARGERMELDAYTPIGTAAMTLFAEGDRVTYVDHMNETGWQGSAADLAQGIGFFDPATPPAMWALDLLGFPARGEFEVAPGGIARTRAGGIAMTFDPPSFPPLAIAIEGGGPRVEVTILELVTTDAMPRKGEIPRGYRCCVAPRM